MGALPWTLAVLEWSPRAGITEIPHLPPGGWEVSVGAVFRGRPGPESPSCELFRPPGHRAGRFDEFGLDSGFVTLAKPSSLDVRRYHRRASGFGRSGADLLAIDGEQVASRLTQGAPKHKSQVSL